MTEDRLVNARQVAEMLGHSNHRSVYAIARRQGWTEFREPGVRGVRWWYSEVELFRRLNSAKPGATARPANTGRGHFIKAS